MRPTTQRRGPVTRFADFTLDLRSGELSRNGTKLRLQEQPLQILAALLEQPGQLVTREELQQRLWPDDTHVDFEHSLNAAIKRLREALEDSADEPRFIETIPRRGYRFIAPVEGFDSAPAPHRSRVRRYLALAVVASMAVAGIVLGFNLGGFRDRLLGRPAPGEITSIAVLPLENLSGDPEQEYFADGMTEALITELGQIRALRVISRTSTMQYKDEEKRKSLPEIARELNVDAVLEGSVAREGSRLRITVQLLQASPERSLWADRFDRSEASILVLQSEVAQAVAQRIRVTLTPREQARLAQTRLIEPATYDDYLKGLYFWSRRTDESLKKAVEYFEKSIASDPNYAPAYAYRAATYFLLGRLDRAQADATRAIALDDHLAEPHVVLGYLDANEHDFSHFERALELNPNSVLAHHWWSAALRDRGFYPEAVRHAERARALDPLSLIINASLARIYGEAGQHAKAREQIQATLEMDPSFPPAHLVAGELYETEGKLDKAIAEYKLALQLGGHPEEARGLLGYAYAVSGNRGAAQRMIEELKALRQTTRWADELIARVYVGLGETDQALYWLGKSFDGGLVPAWAVARDHRFAKLREDPRFQAMLRRLNLPPD